MSNESTTVGSGYPILLDDLRCTVYHSRVPVRETEGGGGGVGGRETEGAICEKGRQTGRGGGETCQQCLTWQ
eukprot:762935-Hanusia_phi.AAC.2